MTELASFDNNAAGVLENALKLMHGFEVVNLRKDADVLAFVAQSVLYFLHIFDRSYVRDNDVVEAILDRDSFNIGLVFVCQNRQGA